MGTKVSLLMTARVLSFGLQAFSNSDAIIPTPGVHPKNEAVTVLINMLTRTSCRRKYHRDVFLSSEVLFCKVDNSPELAFLYKVSVSLIGFAYSKGF